MTCETCGLDLVDGKCPKCETYQFPFSGTCECGWPLLADGTCSDGECPLGWQEETLSMFGEEE